MPRVRIPPEGRYWSKVDVRGPDECWPWMGGTISTGYGMFHPSHGENVLAHRYGYTINVGQIPPGAHIDHTCHNDADCRLPPSECPHRRCQNPAHLDPVDPQENLRRGPRHNSRKTHCPRGHPYTDENTYVGDGRGRRCRECARERDRQPHRRSSMRRRN